MDGPDMIEGSARDEVGDGGFVQDILDVDALFAHVRPYELVFRRPWFFVAATVLAWMAFWDMADRHQESVLSRLLAWTTVLAALWAANNL